MSSYKNHFHISISFYLVIVSGMVSEGKKWGKVIFGNQKFIFILSNDNTSLFFAKEARGEKERATKDEWMREGRRKERNKRKGKKEKYSLLSKLIPFIWTNNYLKVQKIFMCIYRCYFVLHFKTLHIIFLNFVYKEEFLNHL